MEIFSEKVLKIVSKIPKGQVLTYKKVAKMAENPKAYRAVGNVLHKNHNSKIPCHRVICSNGKIGGYNRGAKEKRRLLTQEGIIIK